MQEAPPPFTSDGQVVVDQSLTDTNILSIFLKNGRRIWRCLLEVRLADLLITEVAPHLACSFFLIKMGSALYHSQGRKHQRAGFVKIKSWFPTDMYYDQSLATQLLAVALHTLALSYSGPNPHQMGNDLETHKSYSSIGGPI